MIDIEQDFAVMLNMPSEQILNSFWALCDYFKKHVNDGKCDLVYPTLRRYSLEYERRTRCPILVMCDCSTLVARLRRDGLQ